ncbi:hypothetical protein [uncultured Deefgea sp.]|uniref:hypothetical protein n=1 Tax=uncultured Deefgea sp. TaxID=1304914 RepID=UPI0026290C34|nr:hypothetical protein [uncultured Deefgea sp.]
MMNRAAFRQSLPFDSVIATVATTAIDVPALNREAPSSPNAFIGDPVLGCNKQRALHRFGMARSNALRLLHSKFNGYCHAAIADQWLKIYTHEVA